MTHEQPLLVDIGPGEVATRGRAPMTPALLAALSSAVLPITWRFRATFTQGHVEALLDNLHAGIPLAASLRAALGPTLPKGTFRKRVHDEVDAAEALAAACAACPALRAEVEAAEAEGRARLRVEAECTPRLPTHDAGETEIRIGTTEVQVMGKRDPEGGEDLPRRFVDESGHTPQGATAEARAQEKATCPDCGERVAVDGPGALDDGEPRLREHYLYTGPDNDVRSGMCAGGGKSKDEGPGALRAPEPSGGVAHVQPIEAPRVAGGHAAPAHEHRQPTAAPAVAQAPPPPAWHKKVAFLDVMARSAALDAEAAPRVEIVREMPANPNAEKWARIRAAASAKHGPGLLGLLLHQDDLLAARGMHRISPWWLSVFASFFAARLSLPWLRWILALVGRGGGKSSTLLRFMLVVALFSERDVPPSEAWQWLFISVLKEDARKRIFEAEKLLRLAYGLDVKVMLGSLSIETEDAAGNAIEILSAASTIAGASGPSTMGVTVDEAAKMRSVGANPDVELVVSLAETSRARAGWIGVRCSSAWLMRGAHHAAIIRGSNSANFVATIGPDFIDAALAGYEEVARWESAQGHRDAAAQIRAWARTLHAGSPYVPVWTANGTISAMASRQLLETVAREPGDEDIPIHTYWLRESGSMPLAGDGGPDFSGQCMLAQRITMGLAEKTGGRAQKQASPDFVDPMRLPGMRPEDARYAGPPMGARPQRTNWRTRKAF